MYLYVYYILCINEILFGCCVRCTSVRRYLPIPIPMCTIYTPPDSNYYTDVCFPKASSR